MWKVFRSRFFLRFRIPLFLTSLGLLVSCGGAAPEIASIFWQVEYQVEEERETLRLFVLADDKDGPGDVVALDLSLKSKDLQWLLDDGSLVRRQSRGEQWYGHPHLEMYDGSPFPREIYNLVLRDLGGKSAEYAFRIDTTITPGPLDFSYTRPGNSEELPRIILEAEADRFRDPEFRFFAENDGLRLPNLVAFGEAKVEGASTQSRTTYFADSVLLEKARGENANLWSLYLFDRRGTRALIFGPYRLSAPRS